MDTARWNRIQSLFNKALELNVDERQAFLDRLRETSPSEHDELAALLNADDDRDGFTGRLGVADVAASVFTPYDGDAVGPFVIEKEIGRGAMGVVYKASDSRLDRHVALKFLAASQASEAARQRFITEARAVSRLDHQNICTIFDIGESDDGRLYIAMAYYDGTTLYDRLASSEVSLRDAVGWTREIAEALRYAHDKRVYHRDIKPTNVFLAEDTQVKILDFGVAKLQGVDLTDPGLRIGTAAYMPPEQVLGREVDERGDIWSLGVVLYEALTGEQPFTGATAGETADNVLRADLVPPSVKIDFLPAIADQIVERCLQRDLNRRYQNAEELLVELAHFGSVLDSDSRLAMSVVGRIGNDTVQVTDVTHIRDIETRQVTVVSCTLHTDVAQPTPADREHTAELAMKLQNRCEAFALSQGISYFHSVDCLATLCFGYPYAREDNAERALRSTLELQEDLSSILASDPAATDTQASLRFGLHTGEVIVEVGGHTSSGLIQRLQGEVHVVANRIQEAASGSAIVISAATKRMLRDRLDLDKMADVQLPSSSESIGVYRLESPPGVNAVDQKRHWGEVRSIVGRKSEREILTDCWRAVGDGDGRTIAVRGEAGIGKSRLMQLAATELAADQRSGVIILHCSPYHQNSFLYPLRDWLYAELLQSNDETAASAWQKLTAHLQQHGLDDARSTFLLARLLNIDNQDRDMDNDLALSTPEMQRVHTLQSIVELIGRRAANEKLMLIAEDLHWADASTLELLQYLVDQGSASNMLLLLTFRPKFSADWLNRSSVRQLTIGKLNGDEARELAEDRFGTEDVPLKLIADIASKSDGVPLFVEELCSMFRGGHTVSDAAAMDVESTDLSIPETLRDSLTARLDRRSEYKPIAQLASVIGRESEYSMIRATWTGAQQDLDAGLDYLVSAEVLYRTGATPNARFVFKHALIQDAAYHSLVGTTRETFHRLVADAIERGFPDVVLNQPEVLANHYSNALLPDRAVPYWQAAATSALQRSALPDAIAHARSGLKDAEALPDGVEKLQVELQLLMTLGPALMAHLSWSNEDVQRSYERAREICATLGNPPELFPVLYGLYTYHCVAANHNEGETLNGLCLDIAIGTDDDGLRLEAEMLKGMTHFFYGEFAPAKTLLEESVNRYDIERFGNHCYLYGQDPGMVASSYLALTSAIQGDTEKAIELSDRCVDQTRALKHPFSLAYGLTFAAWLKVLLDRTDDGAELVEEALALCERQHIGIFLGMARVVAGWVRYQQRRFDEAVRDIRGGIEEFDALGAGVLMPFWHGLLSLAELEMGDHERALAAANRALSLAARSGEHWSSAELYRFRARVLLRANPGSLDADRMLRDAIDLAHRQGAVLFEQRASAELTGMG